jgi:hypothetical protein
MIRWFLNLVKAQRRPAMLLVMRAADMFVEHPDTDYTHVCSRCGEPVGIYPSGQHVMQHYEVTLVCNRCTSPSEREAGTALAPGALDETSQSRPVRRNPI